MEDNLKLRLQSFLEIIFYLIETRVDLENPRLLSNTPTQKKRSEFKKPYSQLKRSKYVLQKKSLICLTYFFIQIFY